MGEYVATITSKGQITIPREVRRRLGVDTGDRVAFVVEEDVRLKPARISLDSLYGSVPALPGRATVDFEDQIAEAMDEEASRTIHEMGGR